MKIVKPTEDDLKRARILVKCERSDWDLDRNPTGFAEYVAAVSRATARAEIKAEIVKRLHHLEDYDGGVEGLIVRISELVDTLETNNGK